MHTAKGIYISLRRGRQFKAAGPLVVCAAAAAVAAAATPAAKGGQLHGFHRDLSKAKEVARSKEGANGIVFVYSVSDTPRAVFFGRSLETLIASLFRG